MQRSKFCPKCGKETEKFYDNLCKDCFLQKIEIPDLPEKIVIRQCKICGKFYGDERGEPVLESAVDKVLKKSLNEKEIQSATYRIDKNKIYSEITLEVSGLRKSIELDFDLVEKVTICKFCSQKLSGYFNVILQIRGGQTEKILEEIKTEMERLNKKDELAFISKIEKVKNGVDIYIGSKSAAHKVVNFLKIKYKVTTKISRKQYGIKEGKKVYRDTILILLGA